MQVIKNSQNTNFYDNLFFRYIWLDKIIFLSKIGRNEYPKLCQLQSSWWIINSNRKKMSLPRKMFTFRNHKFKNVKIDWCQTKRNSNQNSGYQYIFKKGNDTTWILTHKNKYSKQIMTVKTIQHCCNTYKYYGHKKK